MIITIPNFRAQSRNMTNKKHWTVYIKHLAQMTQFIRSYSVVRSYISPARVEIRAYYKKLRCVDCSNIDDKIIVDALMANGILRDDNPSENPEVIKKVFFNTGKDCLEIEITQIKSC